MTHVIPGKAVALHSQNGIFYICENTRTIAVSKTACTTPESSETKPAPRVQEQRRPGRGTCSQVLPAFRKFVLRHLAFTTDLLYYGNGFRQPARTPKRLSPFMTKSDKGKCTGRGFGSEPGRWWQPQPRAPAGQRTWRHPAPSPGTTRSVSASAAAELGACL